jgi:hypothetical protein
VNKPLTQIIKEFIIEHGKDTVIVGSLKEPPSSNALLNINQVQICYSPDGFNVYLKPIDQIEPIDLVVPEYEVVVVLDCRLSTIQKIIHKARDFTKILIAGTVRDPVGDIDFYNTVHYKNLTLKFEN